MNNFTRGSPVDPFASTVVPITKPIFAILQYCKSNIPIGAAGYKLEVLPDGLKPMTDMYQAALQYVFDHIIRFEHIMYPILAAFSRRMQTLNDSAFARTQNPDLYLGLAIQAVRKSLAEHMNDREVLSHIATGVHFLVCSSGLGGRFEESKMHIRAFMKLLPYVNTKSAVGYWELDTVSSLDIMLASAGATAPIIKIPTSDPGALSLTRLTQLRDKLANMQQEELFAVTIITKVLEPENSISRYQARVCLQSYDLLQNPTEDFDLSLGSSLQAISQAEILNSSIVVSLRQILDCLVVAKVVWRASGFATKDDTKWLCQKSRAILHDLLSFVGPKAFHTSAITGQLSEALRLTLIIIMTSVQFRVARIARRKYATQLKAALIPLIDGGWNALPWSTQAQLSDQRRRAAYRERTTEEVRIDLDEFMLWMLLTGHWASTGSPEEMWFAQTAGTVAMQRLGLSGLDLHKVMRRYLYSKTVQEASLRTVADMMAF